MDVLEDTGLGLYGITTLVIWDIDRATDDSWLGEYDPRVCFSYCVFGRHFFREGVQQVTLGVSCIPCRPML